MNAQERATKETELLQIESDTRALQSLSQPTKDQLPSGVWHRAVELATRAEALRVELGVRKPKALRYLDESEIAAILAKSYKYDPERVVELAACLMDEINYHSEAERIRA